MGDNVLKRFLALILSIITVLCATSLVACGDDEFTVTFDLNGGRQKEGDQAQLVQVVSDAKDIVQPQVEKEGYEFAGWDVVLADIDEDTTVKAQWTACVYEISFDKNGGVWDEGFTDDYKVSATYGEKITETVPTATKAGFKFEKWVIVDDDSNINGKYFSTTAEYNYAKDITVKAQWTTGFVINYVNADFETGKGKTSFYPDDESFTLDAPIKVGYDFLGWTGEGITTPTKELTINPSDDKYKKELTYTANWSLNVSYWEVELSSTYFDKSRNRTVNYTINGESSFVILKNGSFASLNIKAPTLSEYDAEDYNFLYWAYKDGETYKKIEGNTSESMVSNNKIVLYAVCSYMWIGPY